MKRLAASLAVLVTVGGAGAAAAQQAVRVRGGQHDDFGRIVFDWPEKVQYRVATEGNQLRVEFDKRASFQTGPLFPALNAYIGQAAPGPHGYRITFPLKDQYGIEHTTYGNKVVIDLKDPDADGSRLLDVRVRGGAHDRYDRVVFDWPERVSYDLDHNRGAGMAEVTFGKPAKLNLTNYRNADLSRVLALTPFPGETQVRAELDVKAGARIRDFRLDNRIVVDVFEPGKAPGGIAGKDDGQADGGRQQAKKRDPQADAEAADSGDGASGEAGDPDERSASGPGTAGETATEGETESEGAGPGKPTNLRIRNGDQVERGDDGARGAGAPSIAAGEGPDGAEKADETAKQKAQQAAAVQPPSAQTSGPALKGVTRMTYTPERIARGLAPKAGEIPRHIAPTQVALPWATGPAAVFRRAGDLFLVAQGAPPTSFAQRLVNAADGVTKVQQSMKGDVAVIRMTSAPEMGARLLRKDEAWTLAIQPRAALPARPLSIRAENGTVRVEAPKAGRSVSLEDPGSGSTMDVVTLGTRGRGLQLEKRFQEFSLLPTTQGVVVLPLAEHVVTEVTDTEVVIRGKDQKLAVSSTDLNRNAAGPTDALKGNRLLHLKEWRRPEKSFAQARQELQKKVNDASGEDKPLARLELARFYFAHGLAAEALGALDLYIQNTERRASDPQIKLMKGVAHLLAGDWRKAGKALAHPALDGVQEALPWRAAHAMAAGDDRAALAAFERSRGLLDPYPPSVRKQMRIWAAETYLREGNVPKAEQQLQKLRAMDLTTGEAAEVDYLTARKRLLEERVEDAEALWREVAKDAHAPSRARARFVMIERDLAADRISREEAIKRLERLRFSWRGDEFEAVLLNRLAELYMAGDQYRSALETLEQAAAHLPQTPQAERAAERMRKIFEKLFLKGEADSLSPVKALALYEDFRELTPTGEKGNALIAKLADRLVDVDLLTRAADLLDGQVRHRLSGEQKAATGARLASIHLLNRAPEKAVEALNISRADNLPAELRRKRRYLRARALLKAGRPNAALAPVAGDTSAEATRIRAKIHAEQGNWGKAADNLAELLPDAPGAEDKLAGAAADKVMRHAVALTMAGNSTGLAKLRRRYGDAMAETARADTFQMLTSDDTSDPAQASEQLAQVQRARTFVDGFLNDLRQQASLGE